jgi:hypothetical protein
MHASLMFEISQKACELPACRASDKCGLFSGSQNKEICDSDQYVWTNVHKWFPGVWTNSEIQDDGISWEERRLVSKNRWTKVISWDTLNDLVNNAGYSFAAEAFKTEFKCQMGKSHSPVYPTLPALLRSFPPPSASLSPFPCRTSLSNQQLLICTSRQNQCTRS